MSSISSSNKYGVIALSETWRNSSIRDSELFEPVKYQVFRKNRNYENLKYSRSGGVLLAVKRTISASLSEISITSILDELRDILPLVDLVMVKLNINFCNVFILVV